ncbi:MAG: HAD family phosphatase [Clostridiales bacterium]|nr:HAD family phosphatase [Clostridiales bacterium]
MGRTRIKGAIFDMDGTVIDSMKIWISLGERFLQAVNITPPADLDEQIRNLTLHETAEFLVNELKIPYSVGELERQIVGFITDAYFNYIPEKPGIRLLLEYLRENNVRMCVATNTDSPLARPALERLDLMKYFEFIITCSDVKSGKDKPVIFNEALIRLGTDLPETTVFEDALYAVKTAKSAGFRVIGVYDDTAANDTDEIKSICDAYIRDYTDDLELFKKEFF